MQIPSNYYILKFLELLHNQSENSLIMTRVIILRVQLFVILIYNFLWAIVFKEGCFPSFFFCKIWHVNCVYDNTFLRISFFLTIDLAFVRLFFTSIFVVKFVTCIKKWFNYIWFYTTKKINSAVTREKIELWQNYKKLYISYKINHNLNSCLHLKMTIIFMKNNWNLVLLQKSV